MRLICTSLVVTVLVSCLTRPAAAQENAPEALPPPRSADPAGVVPPAAGYPSLGVTVDPVTEEDVRARNLAVRRGAMITAIVQGSPADLAGLPLGAVIVAFDGERIDDTKDLVAAVRSARTNRPNEISYYDGPRLFRKRVQLLPGDMAAPVPPEAAIAPAPRIDFRQPPAAFEDALGERGRRPVLGQVGRLLDGLVAPAGGDVPFAVPDQAGEIAELRQQVALLQQQLAALQEQMARIEKKLPGDRGLVPMPGDEPAPDSANP